jgi:hypothetical protein
MFSQIALFIGSMGYMEGRSSEHIKEKYKDMYFPALEANWQVWPLVQVRAPRLGQLHMTDHHHSS